MQSKEDSPTPAAEAPEGIAPGPERDAEQSGSPDATLLVWAHRQRELAAMGGTNEGPPILPPVVEDVPLERLAATLHWVRSWHRGEPGAGGDLQTPDDGFVPALLHPFRQMQKIRHDYPLFLFPPGKTEPERLSIPLADLMRDLVQEFATEADEGRILKDNLPRLERKVREEMAATEAPVSAADAIAEAGKVIEGELKLGDENTQELATDLGRLIEALPGNGELLGLSRHAPLYLYLLAARHLATTRRAALIREIAALRHKLHDVLLIDIAKEPERRQADAVEVSVGPAATQHVDTAELAKILGPVRGTETMDLHRRKRIEEIIEHLDRYLYKETFPLMRLVHHGEIPPAWETMGTDWRVVGDTPIGQTASELFDEQADAFAKLFATMRMARLEIVDGFDPAKHEHLLKGFDWEAFSREELLALPPVVAVESAERVQDDGMINISRVQLSGRPIAVLVLMQPASNPRTSTVGDPLMGYRLEMGYRGISYRGSFVHQCSAASPDQMMEGFRRSLQTTRASLHIVACGLTADGGAPPLGAWLHASAAIEGRAHPLFSYDPDMGDDWASRFNFEANPQAQEDWPRYQLPCHTQTGEEQTLDLAFTFADFTLMEKAFRDHYRVIPDDCESGEFVTMDRYLQLPAEDSVELVPYTWAVDTGGRLRRLAMTRRLAFVCRDRLGFWHILQEFAGLRGEHIQAAVRREREKLETQFAEQRAELEDSHAAEIETARSEAAGKAMKGLAATLLQTDVSRLAASTIPSARPMAAPAGSVDAPTEVEAPAEAETVEEDDEGPGDPWINSILCTTCNDCTNINSRLFVYNGSKQATIGDPSAGTFAQLVEAAEKCPSRCIHPGKPLNPDEPNLEELIKRAKPFN